MKKKDIPKVISLRFLYAGIFLAIGVLIAAQIRSIPLRVSNPIAPYVSLKETRDELVQEQNDLKNEIKTLQVDIEHVQSEAENVSLSKLEINLLNTKRAQAGLTRLNGPGVIVTLDDSSRSGASDEAIVHAADIRDLFELLWSAGAEGVSINDQRVTLATAVDCIVNTILVNDVRLSTPFRVEAVGDQAKMMEKLVDQKLLADLYQRRRSFGLKFEFRTNNDITLPIFDGSFDVNLK